jgi:hypothetical protein
VTGSDIAGPEIPSLLDPTFLLCYNASELAGLRLDSRKEFRWQVTQSSRRLVRNEGVSSQAKRAEDVERP